MHQNAFGGRALWEFAPITPFLDLRGRSHWTDGWGKGMREIGSAAAPPPRLSFTYSKPKLIYRAYSERDLYYADKFA